MAFFDRAQAITWLSFHRIKVLILNLRLRMQVHGAQDYVFYGVSWFEVAGGGVVVASAGTLTFAGRFGI